jgi:LysM repeat protein
MRKAVFRAGLAAACVLGSSAAWAQGPCGDVVTVQRADTLSRIAERCNVSEGRLLRANPRIQGSDDLRAGMELKLATASDSQIGGALRSFAEETGDALSGLAREFGSSVEDLLNKNPDLQQRLRSVGERLNIPGVDADRARVTVSPEVGMTGTAVTVSATGLPRNAPVVIGAGPPRQAYDVLDRARTRADGTLQATVQVPEWADAGKPLVFVIAGADGDWTTRSPLFQVSGTKL